MSEKPVDQMAPHERTVELAEAMGWPWWDGVTAYESCIVQAATLHSAPHVSVVRNGVTRDWTPESDFNDPHECEAWALEKFPKEFAAVLAEQLAPCGEDFLLEAQADPDQSQVYMIFQIYLTARRATPLQVVTAILTAWERVRGERK